jgi:acylphosphatase
MATTTQRYHILFTGRVQGVGFRYTTANIARGYDVTGYVSNLPDGRVELVAEGARRELDDFLREVRDYFHNNIRDEKRDTQPATAEFPGFSIRH